MSPVFAPRLKYNKTWFIEQTDYLTERRSPALSDDAQTHVDDDANPWAPDRLSYRTVAEPVHKELTEKHSRFLASLFPVSTEREATEILDAIRAEDPLASHHCYALRVQPLIERASDDGEPQGTAGRPMLHVLQRHDLNNVLAVVTRYFGGTLLGTGGLVRAYTQAVAAALAVASIATLVRHAHFEVTLDYADYDLATRRFEEAGWTYLPTFAEVVQIALCVPASEQPAARALIAGLTRDPQPIVATSYSMRPTL